MKPNWLLVALCLFSLITSPSANASSDEPSPETVWSYSQRDVWIDGELARTTLVYRDRESERLLVIDPDSTSVTGLDPDSGSVVEYSGDGLMSSADLVTVTTIGDPVSASGSTWSTSDGVVMASTGEKIILITRHQSTSGELEVSQFLADYPVWDALRAAYEPDPAAIEQLRRIDEPARLDVIFATWCGDSRREVPRLLKTVEVADNPNLDIHLVGIDSEFEQPLDVIQDRRIINVPTVIVSREGEEIGRMIETPAAETLEAELGAILSGGPLEHTGRWEREARTSEGVYELTFRDGERGTEKWQIFVTRAGGKLTHSVIRAPKIEREIWHRFDAQGRTEFIEITDRTSEGIRRSRIRVSDDHVRVTSRGNRSGIIDQYLGLPQNCVFATGSVLSDGLECGPFTDGSAVEIVRYAVPLDECASVGCLETVKLVRGASTEVDTGVGAMISSEVMIESSGEVRSVWISRDIEIPVRLEAPDRSARLISYQGSSIAGS